MKTIERKSKYDFPSVSLEISSLLSWKTSIPSRMHGHDSAVLNVANLHLKPLHGYVAAINSAMVQQFVK